ncbi:MAG: DUF2062 domain-containing protein [Planctomycetaceae bacterium]
MTKTSNSRWSQLQWWLNPRLWLRSLLMLNDSPHSVALGTAIGMFIAMTPTVGIQMLVVAVVALLTRRWFHFNRVAALIMVYVSNPLTVLPIYWFNFKVGTLWFPSHVSHDQFAALLKYQGFSQWWSSLSGLFVDVGTPLIVGSLVVATLSALPCYPLMLWAFKRFRPNSLPETDGQKADFPVPDGFPTAALAASRSEKAEAGFPESSADTKGANDFSSSPSNEHVA